MNRKNIYLIASLVMTIALALSACGPSATHAPIEPTVAATEAPTEPATVATEAAGPCLIIGALYGALGSIPWLQQRSPYGDRYLQLAFLMRQA